MSPEETASRSLLDKPLHQLTEEDISQITREDCRRYLKDKGMRRPSWNKSQAIQQVISLKTLLETPPDPDSGARKKLYIPRPENTHPRVQKGTSADTPISVSAEESVPYRRKDPERNDVSGNLPGHENVTDNDSPARTTDAGNVPVGQMTIFYCGKVNVYDDVPADKARVIMELAARPFHLPENSSDGTAARQPFPCRLEAASVKVGSGAPAVSLPTVQTVNVPDNCRLHREESRIFREEITAAEGPASRKASVQRYLEKKKDRFKSKRKAGTPSSASLDIYLSHQMGSQTLNEHSSRSDTCSPGQIRPLNTPNRCSFTEENVAKNANLSADLNEKDPED